MASSIPSPAEIVAHNRSRAVCGDGNAALSAIKRAIGADHTDNHTLISCTHCNGESILYIGEYDDGSTEICPTCEGTGTEVIEADVAGETLVMEGSEQDRKNSA